MEDIKFPEVKTFYQVVEDVAKSWARQNNCSYEEATQVILGFAQRINIEAFAAPTSEGLDER